MAEGLLPQPERSARNMAWYDHSHVERLLQIRKLRQEHFLSLQAIKIVINGHGGGEFTDAQLESLHRIRQQLVADRAGLSLGQDPEKMAEELGLNRDETRELRDLGVGAEGVATQTDLEIARQWVKVRDATNAAAPGLMPRDVSFILEAVRLMLDHELDLFKHCLRHLNADQLVRVIQQAVPALSRIFVLAHERAVNQFISDYVERNKPEALELARKPAPRAAARGRSTRLPIRRSTGRKSPEAGE
jgi:DNA-binding transcriptional MerR regulator